MLEEQQTLLDIMWFIFSFMEEQVLGYKSPLYGRRTAQFKIHPFTFFEARRMLLSFSEEAQAILYGITGGIPEYISRIDVDKSLDDNIVDLFFDESGRLFEEPVNLLKQELREPALITPLYPHCQWSQQNE